MTLSFQTLAYIPFMTIFPLNLMLYNLCSRDSIVN